MGRSGVAAETLGICARGEYRAPSGRPVSIREDVAAAIAGTRTVLPGELEAVPPPRGEAPPVEVTGERSGAAARRQVQTEGREGVALLNFASARNPGGGFLGGAKAQEEDLCRASALFPCLEPQRAYYEANRATPSLVYTDHLIWSPAVPFFRDDDLAFLEEPFRAAVITAPAPNAGEERRRRPDSGPEIAAALLRRAALVLALAARERHRVLVLGAWGCGVFKNDPVAVADAFARALETWGPAFERIVFPVWERGGTGPNRRAFEARFGGRA